MKAEKVEPLDQVIDHQVGRDYREKRDHMDTARDAPPPVRVGFRMEIAGICKPCDEAPYLLRVPCPVCPPCLIGPGAARYDTPCQKRKREEDMAVYESRKPLQFFFIIWMLSYMPFTEEHTDDDE